MESIQNSYDALVDKTGKIWNSLSVDEKTALFNYTSQSFDEINIALNKREIEKSEYKNLINAMTSAIKKSSYNRDIVLRRGVRNESSVFGFNIAEASLNQLQTTVGKTYKMKQFGSFGASKDSGYNSFATIILTAPKGTKMIYAEPFSQHGSFSWKEGVKIGKNWDGKHQGKVQHGENEVILQRGTSYRVDRVERVNQKNIVYATVVKQDKH